VTILLTSQLDPGSNLAALLAFFACLSGIYLFGQGALAWQRRRKSAAPSVAAIRSARIGTAAVQGVAEGPCTISAAITGKDCYFYRTTVWQEDSRKAGSWKKAAEETFSLPFFLTDSTGRILLDPRGAEIELPRDVYEEYGKTLLSTHTDVPERLESLLARHPVSPGSTIRIEEYLIEPGLQIFVRGTVAKNSDGFDVSATPWNRVEGGYCPEVHGSIAVASPAETPIEQKTVEAVPPPVEETPSNSASKGTNTTVQPEVIHLSSPTLAEAPEKMTMQSRLAAALRRANAQNPDAWGMPVPEAHAGNVAIQEHTAEHPATNGHHGKNHAAATSERRDASVVPNGTAAVSRGSEIPPKLVTNMSVTKIAPKRPPALILQKGADDSVLLLSVQNPSKVARPSGMAATLIFAGPVLTFVGAYYLLMSLGWL
jgi:hypothetical protein